MLKLRVRTISIPVAVQVLCKISVVGGCTIQLVCWIQDSISTKYKSIGSCTAEFTFRRSRQAERMMILRASSRVRAPRMDRNEKGTEVLILYCTSSSSLIILVRTKVKQRNHPRLTDGGQPPYRKNGRIGRSVHCPLTTI